MSPVVAICHQAFNKVPNSRTTAFFVLPAAKGTGELRFSSDHISVSDPAIISVVRYSLESNFFTLEHRNHAV